MHTVGAFEAKTHFAALLKQVENGEEIIITKHGRPIAKISPATGVNNESVKQAIQHLQEFGRNNTLGGLDWKKLRDEGRR